MNLATFGAEVKRFLSSSDPGVLVISGKWGVGKTVGWKNALESYKAEVSSPYKLYSYVSLFGIGSYEALMYSILINRVPASDPNRVVTPEALADDVGNVSKDLKLKLKGFADGLKFNLYGVQFSLAGLIDAVTKSMVFKQLICFDDLERAASGLRFSDVLGYINHLKEDKKCKVILLLNEHELGENESTYKTQIEKVADTLLQFAPTPSEAASIGLTDEHSHKKFVFASCVKLGITNIRTIKRINLLCSRLVKELSQYDQRIIESAIHFAVLFVYSRFQPNVAPDLNFVIHYNKLKYELNLSDMFDGDKILTTEDDSRKEEFRAVLQDYEFLGMTSFGKVILDFITTGHLDADCLLREATASEEDLKKGDRATQFRAAMKLVTASFAPNNDQVRDGLVEAIRKYPSLVSSEMLFEALAIIRAIEPDYDTDALIAEYIEGNDADRSHWDITSEFNQVAIADLEIMAAFNRKFESFPDDRSLMDVLVALGKGSGWSVEDIQFISKRSSDDYYQLFSSLEGDELKLAVRGAFKFSTTFSISSLETKIWKDATDALLRLSAQSPLNQIRVQKLGVKLYPPTAPPP